MWVLNKDKIVYISNFHILDLVSNEMRRFEFSASSEIDTRPRCVINFPTASNSSCEIKMNLPRSSITPEKIEEKINSNAHFNEF